MTPPQIKICGITDIDTYRHCAEVGISWVGFVHFPASPRHLEVSAASELASQADEMIASDIRPKRVVLTVDASDPLLEQLTQQVRPDMFQLHGSETPERAHLIRQRFGTKIMAVIKVRGADDLSRISEYEEVCDWLLFDAAPPVHSDPASDDDGALLPGGRGEQFDWRYLQGCDCQLPWMLAGGLTAQTVDEAIKLTNPVGLDVSSGVERVKGMKDHQLISQFADAVKLACSAD